MVISGAVLCSPDITFPNCRTSFLISLQIPLTKSTLSCSRKIKIVPFCPKSLAVDVTETQVSQRKPVDLPSRRLILLRHAKSSWENPALRDHDRPLIKDGEADAVSVSQKLQQLGWIPELILSSGAVRTRETLKVMQEQVQNFLKAEVHFIPSFYSIAAMDGQTAEHLQQAICKFARDEILTVMCMGHNRGWEEAASMLSGTSIELQTCNAALLEATGKTWEEAFALSGYGGWKLQGIVKPDTRV